MDDWLESLPAEAAILDPRGIILEVNEPWRRFARQNGFWGKQFGVGESYLAACQTVSPGQDYAGAADGLRRILAGTLDRFELEYPFQIATGTHWYRLTVTRLAGRPGALVMHFDITPARQTGRELLAVEAKLARMTDEVPVGIFHADAQGGCLYVNRCWREMTGMSAEEAMGDGWTAAVHPDDREWLFRTWNASAKIGEPFQLEYRYRHRDGTTIWVNGTATALRDEHGEILGYLGSITDVTPRKNAEQELQEAHRQLQALIDACPLPIAGIDGQGDVLVWNPAAERVFGWTVAEVLGRPLPIVPPEKHEEYRRWKTGALQGDLPSNVETVRMHRDGRRIEVNLSTAPLAASGDHSAGTVAVYTDLTARRQIERALDESRERLRQAQKLEAVGRLAGGVAHDFNNLLTAILSYCDLLRDDMAEPELGMVLEIQDAARRAAGLTRQLLALGRRQIFRLSVVDLNEVLRALEPTFREVAGGHTELRLETSTEAASVHANDAQLQLVLLNLVRNAREAMPTGGRITLRTRIERREGGPSVALSVTDTGTGMDEPTRLRLFEPFFTTRKADGASGLGLATSLGIVEQLGGSIDVTTAPGEGSTFTVFLPFHDSGATTTERTMPGDGEVSPTSATVLVVDDEDNVREAVGKILTRVGYAVHAVPSGAEALGLVNDPGLQIDLVLTDVVMPEMSGVELASKIRDRRPLLPVVFMSGYSESEVLKHGVETNAMVLIRKPFTMEELVQAVRERLRSPTTPPSP